MLDVQCLLVQVVGWDVDGDVVQGPNLYCSLVELLNMMMLKIWFHRTRCLFVIGNFPRCQLNKYIEPACVDRYPVDR